MIIMNMRKRIKKNQNPLLTNTDVMFGFVPEVSGCQKRIKDKINEKISEDGIREMKTAMIQNDLKNNILLNRKADKEEFSNGK
ncbi:MAG: hypothetical protein ABIH83_03455 [Candidatus Micrarchaeota archaeon]